MEQVFGRLRELKILEQLYISKRAEFLAIYGRRRIGKTFLIREFFKNHKGLYFALTGVKGASVRKQLKNFVQEFARVFNLPESYKPPSNWFEAFAQLRKEIEGIKEARRIVLFFDELPWLATPRSGFLQDLDHFWNRYMSEDHRVILIVCGSAASWMIRNIVRNKGGLHGRLTAEIRLLPFDLKETEQFLQKRGITLSRKAIVDIYMAIGGIPKYLSHVQKGQSALQIVGELCFNGVLVNEFDELYASLFEINSHHVNIVKALAKHPNGLMKSEIAQIAALSAGGGMNMILDELEQSGFILMIKDFGKGKKESRYRLVDEYSLFYLKWEPKAKENSLSIRDNTFWMSIFNSPLGQTWAGHAFEMICLKHLSHIKKSLGIAGVLTSASGWVYKAPQGGHERGVQVDLLIDRADHCINLCEIKYCKEEFVVNKTYDKELREKKRIFLEQSKSKKSLFLTLISPYGVKKNVGYFETVDVSLTMDCLF